MKILHGKKTTLFPIAEQDIEYLHFLLKHEGRMMGQVYFKDFDSWFAYIAGQILEKQMLIWTCWTKEGKASKKFGFVSLSDFTPHSVQVHGFTDKQMTKGIVKILKNPEKYTFAEDALNTIIHHVFEDLRIHRIGSECLYSNLPCKKLLERVGFMREGRVRHAVCIDKQYEDVVLYGLIKPIKQENLDVRQQEIGRCEPSSTKSGVQPEAVAI